MGRQGLTPTQRRGLSEVQSGAHNRNDSLLPQHQNASICQRFGIEAPAGKGLLHREQRPAGLQMAMRAIWLVKLFAFFRRTAQCDWRTRLACRWGLLQKSFDL